MCVFVWVGVCGTDAESWAQSPQSFATVDDKLSSCHGYHNTDAPVTSSAMKSGTFSITDEDTSFIDNVHINVASMYCYVSD